MLFSVFLSQWLRSSSCTSTSPLTLLSCFFTPKAPQAASFFNPQAPQAAYFPPKPQRRRCGVLRGWGLRAVSKGRVQKNVYKSMRVCQGNSSHTNDGNLK